MKFFKMCAAFFWRIWNWKEVKQNKKYDNIIAQLDMALQKKTVEQDALKGEILIYMQKFLGVKAWSKFIPKKWRNNAKVVMEVRAKFGDRMKALDIKINDDAEII